MKSKIIAVPSDLHVNSVVGLFVEGQWQKKMGGIHEPSSTQKIIRKQMVECVDRVAYARKKKDLISAFNGDIIEMNGKRPSSCVTQLGTEAETITSHVIEDMLDGMNHGTKDKLYFVSGTEWHTGEQSQHEEAVAEDIGGIPFMQGTAQNDYADARYLHYHLRLNVFGNLVDIAHHGPKPGTREWTKENGLYNELKDLYFSCLNDGRPIPKVWVRSHYHTFVEAVYKGKQGTIHGFVTPGFTTKDGFAEKSTKSKGLADIGMLILEIAEDGSVDYECPRIEYETAPILEV